MSEIKETTKKELTSKRKEEIEEIVSEIRNKYNLSIGFDLLELLTREFSFEVQLRNINDDTTGLLFVDDNNIVPFSSSNRLIVINQKLIDDSEFAQKRRFISAHELGHFLLHKKNNVVFARRDTKRKDDLEEQEAEYFAYCLLLPEAEIRKMFSNEDIATILSKLYNEGGISAAQVVATIFNVSFKKATQRLKELEIEYV